MTTALPRTRTLILAGILLLAALGLGLGSLLMKPETPQVSGTALVGGPFTAVDHTGRTVTEKDFAGRHLLLFFGFTYCPDVCPTALQVMTEALNQMGPAADSITPIFVTVDPERDTVEVMNAYVTNFHPRLVGLTGTREQIAAIARAYRVFYAKVEQKEAPDGYLMDHSSILYLMGPDGKFLKHFTYSTDAAKLSDALRQAIAN